MQSRKIVVLDFMNEGAVEQSQLDYRGISFQLIIHRIGWDFDTGVELIKKYDGYVNGIALSGVQKTVQVAEQRFLHPGYLMLVQAATKTPVSVSDDVRHIFGRWTIQRLLKKNGQLFNGSKVLLHCGIVTSFTDTLVQAGAQINAADSLLITRVPKLLHGEGQLKTFLRLLKPMFNVFKFKRINPFQHQYEGKMLLTLEKWIREHDVFVSFDNILNKFPNFEALRNKILITDFISTEVREKLKYVDVKEVIEVNPKSLELSDVHFQHLSVLCAVLEQLRLETKPSLQFEEYVLEWMQDASFEAKAVNVIRNVPVRSAFIVHPLSQRDIWRSRRLQMLASAPNWIKNLSEKTAARMPVIEHGNIEGIQSALTGREVTCDIYAIAATPKQLMNMDESFVYDRLLDACEMAKKKGAQIIGLGAYTKIVGDGGVTVTRRSPIPVTTGNSLSASTTLWGARVMVERLALINKKREFRIDAKVIIIGATGSIGRVSSLLVAKAFTDIVLVATRPDRLLELKEEILKSSPGANVRISTNANHDVHDADLIVTATSAYEGSLVDIRRVKPGAVICDCSRPFNFNASDSELRPDVMIVHGGEVLLPGDLRINTDIGLPKPAVYACLAETVLLAMEERFESFSFSKQLSLERVKEIYKIAIKHGVKLAEITGPLGVVDEAFVRECRLQALTALHEKSWIQKVGRNGFGNENTQPRIFH